MSIASDVVYWRMRNGEIISVDDMTVEHLRNTLKMIIKSREEVKRINSFLNGDMAQQFNESQENDYLDDLDNEYYWH